MEQISETSYKEALAKLRTDLKAAWGYAPRIARKFRVKTDEVYNVAHGRKKDPTILKALIDEARSTANQKDPSLQLLSDYYQSAA